MVLDGKNRKAIPNLIIELCSLEEPDQAKSIALKTAARVEYMLAVASMHRISQ